MCGALRVFRIDLGNWEAAINRMFTTTKNPTAPRFRSGVSLTHAEARTRGHTQPSKSPRVLPHLEVIDQLFVGPFIPEWQMAGQSSTR